MTSFNSIKIYLLSVSLPIVAVTAAALPHREMSLLSRFDILQHISRGNVNLESVQNSLTSTGMGSASLFAIIVLGPVVVRSILWWQSARRREKEQKLSVAIVIPVQEKKKGEVRPSLITGENPDYHCDHDPGNSNLPQCGLFVPPRHTRPVRHLRIHSLDELPPPTMDDMTPPRSTWSCPTSPVFHSEPPRERSGRRRSPFNPILPGMKTTWEEGVDPVTGRVWRRKLVIYASAFETLEKPNTLSMEGDSGALAIRTNDTFSES